MTSPSPAPSASFTAAPSRALNIALWAGQVLLASFAFGGFMKLTVRIDQLPASGAWMADIPLWLLRTIGAVEILGAIGVILPAVTRIKPWLTPLAAAGLGIIMVLALVFHLARGEANLIAINIVLGAIAAFVAWGRTRRVPIRPRP